MDTNTNKSFNTFAHNLKMWVEQQKWEDIYNDCWIPFARRFEQAQRATKFYNALDQLMSENPQLAEMLRKDFDQILLLAEKIDHKIENSLDFQRCPKFRQKFDGNQPPNFIAGDIELLEGRLTQFCERLHSLKVTKQVTSEHTSGNWSAIMNLKEIMALLGFNDYRQLKAFKQDGRLVKAGNKEQWRITLDWMGDNMRQDFDNYAKSRSF